MIIGVHSVIYSTNPDADRAFLRDIIKLPNVDAGGGYVIFGLPPSEVAVHQKRQGRCTRVLLDVCRCRSAHWVAAEP